jgi:hypothetical protein
LQIPEKYAELKKDVPDTLNKWYPVHLLISTHFQRTTRIRDQTNLTPIPEDPNYTKEMIKAMAKVAVEVIPVTVNIQSQNHRLETSVLDMENPVILKVTARPRQPNVTTVTKLCQSAPTARTASASSIKLVLGSITASMSSERTSSLSIYELDDETS